MTIIIMLIDTHIIIFLILIVSMVITLHQSSVTVALPSSTNFTRCALPPSFRFPD